MIRGKTVQKKCIEILPKLINLVYGIKFSVIAFLHQLKKSHESAMFYLKLEMLNIELVPY